VAVGSEHKGHEEEGGEDVFFLHDDGWRWAFEADLVSRIPSIGFRRPISFWTALALFAVAAG